MRIVSIITTALLLFTGITTTYTFGQIPLDHKKEITGIKGYNAKVNSILKSDNKDSTKIRKLHILITSTRYAKHTFQTILQSDSIAQKNGTPYLMADTYRILGNYYFYNSELDSAEYYLLQSKQLIRNKKNPFISAAVHNALGGVYRKKGNITKAIKTILKGKSILESVDTLLLVEAKRKLLKHEQLIMFNTLANFYNQMGDFDSAIINYDLAYNKALKLKNINNAGVILSNKGDLLLNNGHFKEALEVLQTAKKLKIKGKSQKSSIANTNQNIALALLQTKSYSDALKHINEALDYFITSNSRSGQAESYAIRGSIYYQKDQYQNAIADCTKSKQIAKDIGVLEIQEKACLCLADAYEKVNDYKNALLNHKEYEKVKNHIFNSNNIKRITQLEMQYTFDKENELQQLKNSNLEKENKATIKTLILGVISLLLISGLLFRLYYVRKKAHRILIKKNTEISKALDTNETLIKETHHRVKNNLQIISSLLSMQSRFLEDTKSKEIINDSKNRLKSMSLIHQKLYKENHITGVETQAYFSELITNLTQSYGIDTASTRMNISIDSLVLDVDTAIPLGLLINELISNAFKHGFTNENAVFSFVFSKTNDKQLLIKIEDNGMGMPNIINQDYSKSYGMKLVQTLGKKLKAKIELINNNGLKIRILVHKFTLSK